MDHSPPGSSGMGFSGQEYWNGLLWPPSGDHPNPGIKPKSLLSFALTGRFFTTPGKPLLCIPLQKSHQSFRCQIESQITRIKTLWKLITHRTAFISLPVKVLILMSKFRCLFFCSFTKEFISTRYMLMCLFKSKHSVKLKIMSMGWDFPGGPVVRALCFHCRGHRFDPWLGN